jgi:hypothetical protein
MLCLDLWSWEINSVILSNTAKPHLHEIEIEKHAIQWSYPHTTKTSTLMLTQVYCYVNDFAANGVSKTHNNNQYLTRC